MDKATTHFYILFLEIASGLILTDAQFLPYYPFPGSQESFLNAALVSPSGLVRGHPGRPDAYGASLLGAPVAAYNGRHTWTPRAPYFAAPPPYFASPVPYLAPPVFYPTSYQYPYGMMFVVFPGNFLMRGSGLKDDDIFRREASAHVPKRMEISSRKLKGSFSSASATADSENEKTTADASSFQGKISEEVLRQIFNFRD